MDGTTILYVEEGEDAEWWVSRATVVFVGEGVGRTLSGGLV